MDSKKEKKIRSFAQAMVDLHETITNLEHNVDIFLVPMMGAVPFMDCLYLIDPYFDNSNVYYIPASSSVKGIKKVFGDTLSNIIYEKFPEMPEEVNILSIDEVVGGGSIRRVKKGIISGITKYFSKQGIEPSNYKNYISKFKHVNIGIEDGRRKFEDDEHYMRFKELGHIIGIEVEEYGIVTMDNPNLCPLEYRPYNDCLVNSAEIQESERGNRKYEELLKQMGIFIGAETNNIDSIIKNNNHKAILDQKYVPKKYFL